MKLKYEAGPEFDEQYDAEAYRVDGWAGIAWYALGYEVEQIVGEDDEGFPYDEETRTGKIVCMMVGDDRHFAIDPSDLSPLADNEYCPVCGQIGCAHGRG